MPSLLWKYNRSKALKSLDLTQQEPLKLVLHTNFVDDIESALHVKTVKVKVQKDKAEWLNTKLQKMLSDSWHQSESHILFLKSLHSLIVDKKLSEFDISFITNFR